MKLGFFPGCSLLGSSREYNESLRAVAPVLGLELVDVPDWNCCGASAAHSLNRKLSLALPARILALAEKAGLDELLVPCSACYSRLAITRHELLKDEDLRHEICEIVELDYYGSTKVLNVLEVLTRLAADGLAAKVVKPFDYRVACYYGCYLTRPPKVVQFDRAEDPQTMDELMRKIGAESIDWAFKVECCGAGFSVSRLDLVAKLSGQIVADAVSRGAEAIVVACPMCHTNLDLRRDAIERSTGQKFSIPVLYISQAIGLALGLDERALGLHRHNVPVVFPVKPAVVAPARATAAPGSNAETDE